MYAYRDSFGAFARVSLFRIKYWKGAAHSLVTMEEQIIVVSYTFPISASIVTWLWSGRYEVRLPAGRIFIFATMFRLALGPSRPPVQ